MNQAHKRKNRYRPNHHKKQGIKLSLSLSFLFLLVSFFLILNYSLAFFSDSFFISVQAKAGQVSIELTNSEIGTDGVFASSIDPFTTGKVYTFHYTVNNTGTGSESVSSRMQIAWDVDNSSDLNEADVIYLYPATMADSDIITNITSGNASQAIINYTISDQNLCNMANGDTRTGFVIDLPQIDLNKGESQVCEYKIIFGTRPGVTVPISYFDKFIGENLKIEVDCTAQLQNRVSSWYDNKNTIFMLNNAQIDSSSSVFDFDTMPPVIALNPETVTIAQGTAYSVLTGVTATDDVDGDITAKITYNSNLDANTLGTYSVTYTVSDNAGNTASAVRTIIVGRLITDGFGYSGVVGLNPLTGNISMTGYNAWPSGFTLPSYAFISGIYDDSTKSIWLPPAYASAVVKMNTTTGAMTSYNAWPSGFTKGNDAFHGGVATDTDIWLVPFNADRVIKIDKSTGAMTGYNSWPSGFTKGTSAFYGGVLIDTDMWMIPSGADRVVKIDLTTGVMTGYANFPTGYTASTDAFRSGIYDGKYLWLIPSSANMVIRLDPDTGTMTGYNSWPTGFTKGAGAFCGATFDGTNVWMSPMKGNRVVKIDVDTGVMTGYAAFPTGYSAGTYAYTGAIYDGKTVWLVPCTANMVIGIDALTRSYDWIYQFANRNIKGNRSIPRSGI